VLEPMIAETNEIVLPRTIFHNSYSFRDAKLVKASQLLSDIRTFNNLDSNIVRHLKPCSLEEIYRCFQRNFGKFLPELAVSHS
jgi:hypothetical protein